MPWLRRSLARSSAASLVKSAVGQVEREVVKLQPEVVGGTDLADSAPPAAASSTKRCVALTGRGETPCRAIP